MKAQPKRSGLGWAETDDGVIIYVEDTSPTGHSYGWGQILHAPGSSGARQSDEELTAEVAQLCAGGVDRLADAGVLWGPGRDKWRGSVFRPITHTECAAKYRADDEEDGE